MDSSKSVNPLKKNIKLYQNHKADTGIVIKMADKWYFKNTFHDDINMHSYLDTKMNDFLIKFMFGVHINA